MIPPAGAAPTWNARGWAADEARFETKLQVVHKLSEGRLFQFGREYTKREYEAMAKEYEAAWASAHGDFDANDPASVERAFWDIVEMQSERASVEYGNDLDVKVFGTGFAADESGEKHPWDFEHLYSHPLNLLRVIEHDIPGLTKPWLYLGMLFATFCWHVEDHFLCSLNYLHRGAPKTWYGVPGSDAEAFENCARATVPRLFEQAPDILHQIVTMVPPGILVDHGVKVVHTVQRPGEFIVTFPRSYHAGFSHGFNVGEAVNFGHVNWLDFGRRAIDVYSAGTFKRNAVFAHHRLIARAAETFADVFSVSGGVLRSKSMAAVISTLRKELESILSDEEIYRSSLVRRGLATAVVDTPNEDDDTCCIRCKSIPFLSVVRCKCLPYAVRCLRHAMDGCECAAADRCLEIRVMGSYVKGLLRSLLQGEPVQKGRGKASEEELEQFLASVNLVATTKLETTLAEAPPAKKPKAEEKERKKGVRWGPELKSRFAAALAELGERATAAQFFHHMCARGHVDGLTTGAIYNRLWYLRNKVRADQKERSDPGEKSHDAIKQSLDASTDEQLEAPLEAPSSTETASRYQTL